LASELCQTVGDEFFFTLHSFLEVGKTQDLPSKFWQTLGDALSSSKLYLERFDSNQTSTYACTCLFVYRYLNILVFQVQENITDSQV
jgi:hypothetical protein